MNLKLLALMGVLTVGSVGTLPILEQAAIAQAPYFTTQAQLDAKYNRVRVGWTFAQVEALLGQPQWGGRQVYKFDYSVKGGLERTIQFGKNGRVIKKGGGAG